MQLLLNLFCAIAVFVFFFFALFFFLGKVDFFNKEQKFKRRTFDFLALMSVTGMLMSLYMLFDV